MKQNLEINIFSRTSELVEFYLLVFQLKRGPFQLNFATICSILVCWIFLDEIFHHVGLAWMLTVLLEY